MSKPLDDAWVWLKAQMNSNALVLALLLGLALIGGANGRGMLEAVADDRIQPVRRQADVLERRVDRCEQVGFEIAKDVRELYRVSPWVRPSPRLEAPFPVPEPDGGMP